MPLMQGLRRGILALALGASFVPAIADTITLDIPAAHALARAAALQGRPDLARAIALGLLQRDAGDPEALTVLAAAYVQLGQPLLARRAAALAFRSAHSKPARYEAARLAAKAAFDQRRLGLSQFWLRKAAGVAPDPASYADSANGFRQVQAQNRWHNTFQFSVTPSSNVNQGSSTDRLIIDGVPTILSFTPDAQALSGIRIGLEAGTRYRLAANATASTEFGLRLVANQVVLSDAARQQAPGAKGSDYAYQALEATLTRSFTLRPGTAPLTIALLGGKNFFGGLPLTNYTRLQFNAATIHSPQQALRWQALVERQWPQTVGGQPSTILAVEARFDQALASGDRLGFRLGLTRQQSENLNAENHAITAEMTYTLAKPVGPANVNVGLTATKRGFPVYFNNLFSTTGRHDLQLGLHADLEFAKLQVWGFAPLLTLTASRTHSNISRFEASDLAIQLGLKSVF